MRALSFVALGIAACVFGQALAFLPPGPAYTPTPYAASSTVGLAKTHARLPGSKISLQRRKWRVDWGMRAISFGSSEEYGGAVPALYTALAEERLNKTMLLERARWVALETKEKETELTKLKVEMEDKEVELARKELELTRKYRELTRKYRD